MSDMYHNPSGYFLNNWHFPPVLTLMLLSLGFWYWWNSESLTRAERISFYLGLASCFAVIVTPIGALATTYFWCHMVQHMVLMMLSGPLLVMGSVRLFRPCNIVWKTLTNPWVSWSAYAGLMIGVHFTALHEFTMSSWWMHELFEIPAYLIFAYLFYYNILDRNNPDRVLTPAISVLMLFFMMVPETLTGFFIYAAPNSLYEGMFTINDQRLGGALMWSGSMILDSIWLVIAVSDWLKSETEKSKKLDEEIAREEL